MVRSWFFSEKTEGGVALAEFVRRVAEGMSCFFGCFRVNDSHRVPPPEPVVSHNKNALSSLFLCDDETPEKREKRHNLLPEELDFRELKDEAKFLKTCGTLPKTPVEILQGSEKWEEISTQNGEGKSLKFNLEKLSHESPTPVKICEESASAAGSLDETPSSCMTDGHNSRRVSISSFLTSDIKNVITYADVHDSETRSTTSSISPVAFAPSEQGKNKSVRFDCNFDESTFSSKDSSSEGASQGLKLLPKPTPLKLTEEMQTPGTVFPAYMSNTTVGKPTRVSSQYVYTVQNDYENNSEWKGLKAEVSDSYRPIESPILNDETIFTSKNATKDISLTKQDGYYNEQCGSFFGENLVYGRTPGDRPILGMVAAHWKDDENDHTSPVVWDGNGIPNSTNKYKEDQKVKWHATPFEERLEKALSEGTFVSQRKPMNGTPPVEFEETDESDTALSHLQSPAHFKSVVSC